jgi:site-specific recombinase
MPDTELREALLPRLEGLASQPPGPTLLAQAVDLLRPGRRDVDPAVRLRAVAALLAADPALAASLREVIAASLGPRRWRFLLVEGGILQDRSVWALLRETFGRVLLPEVPPPEDARALLPAVLQAGDWRWIRAISTRDWAHLLEALMDDAAAPGAHPDVALSIRTLAQRIGGSGTHEELRGKLAHDTADDAPFLALPIATNRFLTADGADRPAAFEAVRALVGDCRAIVRRLRVDKPAHGTSLHLTRLTRRLDQQLLRFEALLRLLHPPDDAARSMALAGLLQDVTQALLDDRLSRQVGQSVDLLAYQITEHTAAKGAKVIRGSRRDWARMLLSAMAGGALVGVFAIVQLFLKKLPLPLGAQAFVYGLNYAVCFVLVYLVGGTIATKQPAVTASALAKRLDEAETRGDGLAHVADGVVQVSRMQFVSFLGNLLCAFPVAWLTGRAIEHFLGAETVTEAKAQALLLDNHPFEGPTLFYAGIAGVFLFVAGVVQGAVDNRIVYTRLKERLATDPRLRFLGGLRKGLAKRVAKNAGALSSNVVLGFLLGSAGVVGTIFGLPLEIRHIAFSSAHVGVAVLDAPWLVDLAEGGVLLAGVLGIGTMNFLVSFGLTLMVTLRSRRVTVTQGWALLRLLAWRLLTSPLAWVVPVGVDAEEQAYRP